MATEITLTELASTAPDIVRAAVLQARYAKSKVVPLVLSGDADVAAKGDRVSLTIVPALTVVDVGSGGSVAKTNSSTTSVEILVDQWRAIRFDIEDRAEIQSAIDAMRAYTESMGNAIAADQDTKLLALHASFINTAVGGAVPLSDTAVRAARLTLDRLNVPEDDRSYVLHPDAEADLLALPRFTEAQNTGFARGVQVDKGRLNGLYGIPVTMTSLVAESAALKKNLLFHKEGLGIATQRNFKIVPLAKIQLSTDTVGHILYGVLCTRTNHGIVMNSAPTP